ncbi:hypothetical protein [Natronorubrum sulfidifaciens]|uniref:Uncharacterized protein n=1 Tax=Natronorubrum sulfidifaciens JCM 14089 TaxID=1230460 RepID=L9WFT8_9EURY|nr:hypothetical protein [Natronorubrum sulfidifaciens]ELY48324.1 hypothetical protein C495_02590 [Natronorubrum sulfidifaciens JCM 14089]
MIDPLERIRRREYTGENRCWPCTITNSVLLAALVGTLTLLGRRTIAGAVAVVGTAAIALRGYVVPYTPRFAPALVAALPIDPFDHGQPAAASGSLSDSSTTADGTPSAAEPTGKDVLRTLLEAGVLVPEGDDIQLTDDVRDDWRREMRTLREAELATLARIADEQTESSIDARAGRNWSRPMLVLERDGGTPVTLRRSVAIAELAAVCALESHVDAAPVRRAAGRPMRSLLETCPLCETELTITQSSCCGETTPVGQTPSEKLVCPACDERVFTFDDAGR